MHDRINPWVVSGKWPPIPYYNSKKRREKLSKKYESPNCIDCPDTEDTFEHVMSHCPRAKTFNLNLKEKILDVLKIDKEERHKFKPKDFWFNTTNRIRKKKIEGDKGYIYKGYIRKLLRKANIEENLKKKTNEIIFIVQLGMKEKWLEKCSALDEEYREHRAKPNSNNPAFFL